MWRRNAVVVALLLVPAWARQSNAEQSAETLVSQQSWARFEIVLGRITAVHLRGGQDHRTTDSPSQEAPRESISVNGDAAAPAFRYERVCPDQTLVAEVNNCTEVDIRAECGAGSEATSIHLRQPSEGPLRLTVREADQQQEFAAPSLWHLLLNEPLASRQYLVPMLQVLRVDWRLMAAAEEIESELFKVLCDRPAISRSDVVVLVAQLDSRQFAQRQLADRRLRALGVSALPYLRQLDRSTLSGEQRQRLQRIQASLSVPAADTPGRVAAWLSNDKTIWLGFLNHPEPAKRQLAADRLMGIHPGVVHFDPLAEESLRREQIALLRSRLGARY